MTKRKPLNHACADIREDMDDVPDHGGTESEVRRFREREMARRRRERADARKNEEGES